MAKAIMVQGTTSNAGKSLIAAALCRIFKQDGYKVAPFKSQNMALNSFITHEGLEMGRAQVMQAEAAGIEPSVLMNPILLKPTGDTGSQVIVKGEVLDNMPAREYYAFKKELRPVVEQTYAQLAAENDIIVIEGAGSPAEINLKADDFVNMGMAKIAKAPVVIVGDIDRGGVFASLYGTVALLDDDERALVKATLINKFRGDVTLLEPGLEQLRGLTGVPVLGVVPYLRGLDIDDEDSLSARIEATDNTGKPVDVAVIRLPHVSNFTDLNALERYPQVGVRYVERPEQLGNPHMVVLPGTKNTMDDLAWLRRVGLELPIKVLAESGTIVLGICGGYQMLGERISDPNGVEAGGMMDGMRLLPTVTVFNEDKRRSRVTATLSRFSSELGPLGGTTLEGYEIHNGSTTLLGFDPGRVGPFSLLKFEDGRHVEPDGCVANSVIGTYCHGLFDGGSFAPGLVRMLCERAGVEPAGFPEESLADYKDRQYNDLAEAVRRSCDMDLLRKIVEEGV